jgi:hypothetical protein
MGEVEGQDGGGRGRAGSIYMFDERGAGEARVSTALQIPAEYLTLARHICRRHQSRRSWWQLVDGGITRVGALCRLHSSSVLPPIPAFR